MLNKGSLSPKIHEVRRLKGACNVEHPVDVAAVDRVSGKALEPPPMPTSVASISGLGFQTARRRKRGAMNVRPPDPPEIDAVGVDVVRLPKSADVTEKTHGRAAVVHAPPHGFDKFRGHCSTQDQWTPNGSKR